jgi:lipid-binding SYLF domain-containing protein
VKALTLRADILGRALLVCLTWLLLGGGAQAADKVAIDKKVAAALSTFRQQASAAGLLDKAAGVLVFPDVVEMGFGIGGEYGEGALLVDGKPEAYYSTAGSSLGLQVGAQYKAQIILFMTDPVLKDFRKARGWEAGVDGSIALARFGAGGAIDTNTLQAPIIGFVFSNRGFMYNLSLEGSRITPIKR